MSCAFFEMSARRGLTAAGAGAASALGAAAWAYPAPASPELTNGLGMQRLGLAARRANDLASDPPAPFRRYAGAWRKHAGAAADAVDASREVLLATMHSLSRQDLKSDASLLVAALQSLEAAVGDAECASVG